jgi:hypothetical protein
LVEVEVVALVHTLLIMAEVVVQVDIELPWERLVEVLQQNRH